MLSELYKYAKRNDLTQSDMTPYPIRWRIVYDDQGNIYDSQGNLTIYDDVKNVRMVPSRIGSGTGRDAGVTFLCESIPKTFAGDAVDIWVKEKKPKKIENDLEREESEKEDLAGKASRTKSQAKMLALIQEVSEKYDYCKALPKVFAQDAAIIAYLKEKGAKITDRITFQYENDDEILVDIPEIRDWVFGKINESATEQTGMCGITLKNADLSILVPEVKTGMKGAKFFSTNEPAFSHWQGLESKAENRERVPISKDAAQCIVNALYKLWKDKPFIHRIKKSGQSKETGRTICWSNVQQAMNAFEPFCGFTQTSPEQVLDALQTGIKKGSFHNEPICIARFSQEQTVLTPHAVWPMDVETFGEHLDTWAHKLRFVIPSPMREQARFANKVRTVIARCGQINKTPTLKELEYCFELPPKWVSEQLMRSMVTGQPIPWQMLLLCVETIVKKVKVSDDQFWNVFDPNRLALMRAAYNDNLFEGSCKMEEVLDPECESVAYLIGRALAICDTIYYKYHSRNGGSTPEKPYFVKKLAQLRASPAQAYPEMVVEIGRYCAIKENEWGMMNIATVGEMIKTKVIPSTFNTRDSALFLAGFFHEYVQRIKKSNNISAVPSTQGVANNESEKK